MNCNLCQSIRIFFNDELTCPKCNHIPIIDKETSIKIAKQRIKYIRQLWEKEITKIHRDSLIYHLVNQIETTATKFFMNPPILDINKIFSNMLFIKQVMETGNKTGAIKIDHLQKAQNLIELFDGTKQVELDIALIDSENAVYVMNEDVDMGNISDEESLKKFTLVITEDYQKFLQNYEDHNLTSPERIEDRIRPYAEEYTRIFQNRNSSPRNLTRVEFIEINYDVICTLYLAFLRNEVYSKVFEIRKLKDITTDPSRITDFAAKFPIIKGILNGPNYSEFMDKAVQHFRKSKYIIQKSLIFNENNQNIFPLFVRVEIENKDMVLVPHSFTLVMYIFLHAILRYDDFNAETKKRGREFEPKTQKQFETLGYTYYPNIKQIEQHQEKLEIDGIAVKGDTAFVIECKNPRLPPEFESYKAKQIMIEDLKGIVDGIKRKNKNGKIIIKNVPSLPEKIAYVKTNLIILGIQQVSKHKIFGLIITGNVPILSDYKGIKILKLSSISSEELTHITSC
jgi:hypothetical protein